MTGSVLALIPARGGSRGIPGKNLRSFAGRPLLAWAVDAALRSGVSDRVIVSTDDVAVRAAAIAAGAEAPFFRPAELATDDAPTADAVRHALEWLERADGWRPDVVAILEPTSPGRRPFHVGDGVRALAAHPSASTVASISRVPHHFVPPKILRLSDDGTIAGSDGRPINEMIHRRQDLAAYHAFDGILFACRSDLLRRDPPTIWGDEVIGYVVDAAFSFDLDDPGDWDLAETRMRAILEREAK